MKDHELRELINDVTAVARIYAHTQQLREQIAQLIAPAINGLNSENAYLRGFKLGAEERIKRMEDELAEYIPVINMLILCGEEPCRNVESYPDKLRALIDAYITIKRQLDQSKSPTPTPSSDNTP